MLGDALEHVAQVRFGVEVVELRRAQEAVDRGASLAAVVGSSEQHGSVYLLRKIPLKGRYRQGQKKWSGNSGVYPHHDARRLDDGVDALALGQAQVFDGVDGDDRHNVDSRSDFDGDLRIDRSHLDFSYGAGQGVAGAQLHGTLQWCVRPL